MTDTTTTETWAADGGDRYAVQTVTSDGYGGAEILILDHPEGDVATRSPIDHSEDISMEPVAHWRQVVENLGFSIVGDWTPTDFGAVAEAVRS